MNKFNRILNGSILKVEADDGVPDGAGLLAGLRNIGKPETEVEPDFVPTDTPDNNVDGLPPTDDNGAPIIDIPARPDVDPTPIVDDDDIGLPGLSSLDAEPEPDATPAFDGGAFDAETAKLMKSLEDKGHPGDVYKDLRAKLKEFESGSAAAPEKDARITELEAQVTALSETAAEVDAMKERVSSISNRNAILLLEENADYQAKVVAPHGIIKDTVAALAEARSVPAKDIWGVIEENDVVKRTAMLDELEKSIGGRHAMEVGNMARDIRIISAMDKDMRANAESIVTKARDAELGQTSAQAELRVEAFRGAAKESFDKLAAKIPGFTTDAGTLSPEAQKSLAKTRLIKVGDLSTPDLGYMAFTVEALPQALKHIKALERQVQDLKVATNTAGTKILPGTAPAKPDPGARPTGTFLDGFNAEFGPR